METQIGDRKRARGEAKVEAENLVGGPSLQTREGRRTVQSQRSRVERLSHNTSLLDFAPNLMTKFSSPPSSEHGGSRAHVRNGKRPTKESPLRSPLHAAERGVQETTPHRGRRAPHSSGNSGAKQRAARIRKSSDVSKPPQDETATCSQSNDRRVRKCLWAGQQQEEEEEDEAFCEAEDIAEEPVTARDPPKTPTKEQLIRRQKDIDYGKATVGYKNYLDRVPKRQRGNLCPQTPDKQSKVPRRMWDVSVRNWRRALHNWDVPCRQSAHTTPSSSPTKLPIRLGDKTLGRGEGMSSPVSSLTSSPSDRGYVTTPDSRCDLSSLDLDHDEDDLWLEDMDHYPPLPSEYPPLPSAMSAGQTKPWWQRVEEEEEEAAKAEEGTEKGEEMEEEEEHLNQYVEKLKIGLQETAEPGKDNNAGKLKKGENPEKDEGQEETAEAGEDNNAGKQERGDNLEMDEGKEVE